MNQTPAAGPYRKDIDGLRAIAALSVILFHFGYLPNGYLGVDVFFAISGFLITRILHGEMLAGNLSLARFYLRRTRRIIPLVLFISLTALVTGLFVMLPDDLENLSQSVIATNFFSNNLLLWFTTGNYWNIANHYKPLMHTWSLGVEEQFYLIYPLLFLLLGVKRKKYLLPLLLALSLASLGFFLGDFRASSKFYLIQFRFFELALGGLGAILFNGKNTGGKFQWLFLAALVFILSGIVEMPAAIKLVLTVTASVAMLVSAKKDAVTSFLLQNPLMVGIGKISFSLYMWHQLVLAYTRYTITDYFSVPQAIVMLALIFTLSIFSYFAIEQPFRNKQKVKTKTLLISMATACIVMSAASFYLYYLSGIVRDVPELDKYYGQNKKLSRKDETNILYNSRIYEMDRQFSDTSAKIKVLVVGDSFARDWSNVLLESVYGNKIELSYIFVLEEAKNADKRFSQAQYIFFSALSKEEFQAIRQTHEIDTAKVWMVGTKNFGVYNGVFYNKKHDAHYCSQRTEMDTGYFEKNELLKKQWGSKYIDLVGMVIDKEGKMPVFTPGCKFISQDAHHLTSNGAVYFAGLLPGYFAFR
jgi:peptidoglycan/LPS O-acetylase OafA/YrhL